MQTRAGHRTGWSCRPGVLSCPVLQGRMSFKFSSCTAARQDRPEQDDRTGQERLAGPVLNLITLTVFRLYLLFHATWYKLRTGEVAIGLTDKITGYMNFGARGFWPEVSAGLKILMIIKLNHPQFYLHFTSGRNYGLPKLLLTFVEKTVESEIMNHNEK
jgi:hypothetical protein